MIEKAAIAEQAAVIDVARRMVAAARTAPKARGIDHLDICIVSGEDIKALADEMDKLADELGYSFFQRDAANIRYSAAVVVIGTKKDTRGLGEGCGLCGFKGCEACAKAGGLCFFDSHDMGIAVGSAVSVAADARIDNRVMFSAGKAAMSLQLLDPGVKAAMAIPLSVSGKSPYFDR